MLLVGRGGRRRRARVADAGGHVRPRRLLGAELPGVQGRAPRRADLGVPALGRRRRSTAGTRCASATCSSSSRRRRRRPRSLGTVRPGGLVVLNRDARFAARRRRSGSRASRRRGSRGGIGIVSSEGRPMGNVAVLGACVRLLAARRARRSSSEAIERAHGRRVSPSANVAAAREGYARCTHAAHARRRRRGSSRPARPGTPAPGRCSRSAPPTRSPTTRARGRSSGPCSSRRATPARCARSSARKARSRAPTA